MIEVENILISLDACHAQNIYGGTKTVELRRRQLHVNAGDVVWIYEKVPVGAVTGNASIRSVQVESPAKLWRWFGPVSGLSKAEFFRYFAGLETACAIELSGARRLHKPLSLAALRVANSNFQPPQFFLRLKAKQAILAVLQNAYHKLSADRLDGESRLPCSRETASGDVGSHYPKPNSLANL